MNNSYNLTKILNGINSTLNIANKAIPIYNQAKPLVSNLNKTYKTLKNNSKDIPQLIKLMKVKKQIKQDMNNTPVTTPKARNYYNTNNPKFFI